MAAHLALPHERDVEVLGADAVPELVEPDDVCLGDRGAGPRRGPLMDEARHRLSLLVKLHF